MIRKLQASDYNAVEALLSKERLLNLYMLSNMAQLGFENELCEFWGDFADTASGDVELRGVVNRYLAGWAVYGREDAHWQALADIVDAHPTTAVRLQDNPGGVDSFLPFLNLYTKVRSSEQDFMALDSHDFCEQSRSDHLVRRATMDDLEALTDFYADAESMSRSRAAIMRPLRDLRVWMALDNDTIQSAALTNAELSDAALIGGVYTKPAARGHGLSSDVCSAMCAELIAEKKQPVLYWETPAAGKVYRRLGFHSIGTWRSVWLKRREEATIQ